jgi:tetratricopeptide (TPR) repeat protein
MSLMASVRSVLGLVLLAAAPAPAEAPRAVPVRVEGVIESLARDLGAERYEVREQATEVLRRVGPAAADALEKAAESDDPEVRIRARRVLADVRLGIGSDWPAEMALLVRHYDGLNEGERQQTMYRLSQGLGDKAVPFLVQRLASDNPREAQNAFYALQRLNSDEAASGILAGLKAAVNPAQANALSWARYRAVGGSDAPRVRVTGPAEAKAPNEVVEKAIQDCLAQIREGKSDQAAGAAREAAKAVPQEPRLAYLQAEACAALGKNDDAKALRERAFAMNPTDELPHARAAEMLEDLGRRRLAAREWESVLKIPPADGAADVNAHLHLAALCNASGIFDRAAASLRTALELLTKARDAGQALTLAGGTEDELRAEVQQALRKASQYPESAKPDGEIVDEVPDSELAVTVARLVKNGTDEDLGRAMATASAVLAVDVQPPELRLFDEAKASLRYDPQKKQLVVTLGGKPCSKPVPFDPKANEGEARVAVESLDRCYIFNVKVATGEAEQAARYEYDYRVTLKPGSKLLALADVVVRVNGKRYDWTELQTGTAFDYLPKALDVVLEGTSPNGRRVTSHLVVRVDQRAARPVPAVKAAS